MESRLNPHLDQKSKTVSSYPRHLSSEEKVNIQESFDKADIQLFYLKKLIYDQFHLTESTLRQYHSLNI